MTEKEALELIKLNNEDSIKGYEFLANRMHDTTSMIILANYYYSKKEYYKTIDYFKKAGDYKDSRGFTNLGSMYYYGRGVEKNYEMAYKYFTKAYLLSDKFAALKLSDMYMNGYYVRNDYSYALEYLEPIYTSQMIEYLKGNKKDNLLFEVLLRYAKCYEIGKGFAKSLDKALKSLIIAKDGFEYQMNFNNKSYNLLKYTRNEIKRLSSLVDNNKFEIFDSILDNKFDFTYDTHDTNVVMHFNFNDKILLVSTSDLKSYLVNNVDVTFNNIKDFNKIEYDVMRPIDYQVKNDLFRLYDEDSTLMHFKFESFETSLHKYKSYYDLIDLLVNGNVCLLYSNRKEMIYVSTDSVKYLDEVYKSIDDFILNSSLRKSFDTVLDMYNE